MSVQSESQEEPEISPIVGAGWLLSFAAAAVSLPIDALLRGMVAAGQGFHAILDYLGLSRMALEAHIVRLGLPMPHERLRRRAGGRNPWADDDVRRLIAWRLAGVHPETIGVRLGRSVGAIRSKARRLGVPRLDRRALRKFDPTTLTDPPACVWAENLQTHAAKPTPEGRCGTGAGAPSIAGGLNETSFDAGNNNAVFVDAAAPAQSSFDLGAVAGGTKSAGPRAIRAGVTCQERANRRKRGQRELGLLQVVGGADVRQPEAPFPATHHAVDFTGDLTWMGRMACPQKSDIYVWALGLLFMSGLHWREIAERIGRKPGSVRSMRTRFGIPKVFDRRKLTVELDPLRGKISCSVSKYIIKRCIESGTYFWCHRDDRTINTCPMVRRKKGLRDQRIEGRSPLFHLVSREEIERLPRRLVEPFANNEWIVGVA